MNMINDILRGDGFILGFNDIKNHGYNSYIVPGLIKVSKDESI